MDAMKSEFPSDEKEKVTQDASMTASEMGRKRWAGVPVNERKKALASTCAHQTQRRRALRDWPQSCYGAMGEGTCGKELTRRAVNLKHREIQAHGASGSLGAERNLNGQNLCGIPYRALPFRPAAANAVA